MVGDGAGSGGLMVVSPGVWVPMEQPPPHTGCASAFCTQGLKSKQTKKGIMGNKSICVAEALTLYCSIWKRIFIHFYGLFFNFWF